MSRPGSTVPILAMVLAVLVIWYLGAVGLNWATAAQGLTLKAGIANPSFSEVLSATMTGDKPVLPAPHQVAAELWNTVFSQPLSSKRSLVYHAGITLSATLLGFAFGSLLGIGLAVLIVHNAASDRSLMPWIIASQTIPILAIAPMLVVGLNAVGITGLVPKATISMYLSFFPVVVGMVKGFRSPEIIQLDLMRTYNASNAQVFFKLRWPIALPYLFTSMKVGIAASLVGAIVGELSSGGGNGLGARLLAGSYYGQTIQIWAALFVAAIVAGALVIIVGFIERRVVQRMGARPA